MKSKLTALAFLMAGGVIITACNPSSKQETTTLKQETVMTETHGIIQLLPADMSLKTTAMEAFKDRKSTREYANKPLSLEQVSSLLWAANGINRPDSNRTAPSALHAVDIDIYVCMENGAYVYEADKNQLTLITKEDLRQAVASGQDFVLEAPVSLVMVSDLSRFPEMAAERAPLLGAMDAAYVSGNIGIYCAATGLATVPRATMDVVKLKEALKLKDSQIPMLNNPVGHFK